MELSGDLADNWFKPFFSCHATQQKHRDNLCNGLLLATHKLTGY